MARHQDQSNLWLAVSLILSLCTGVSLVVPAQAQQARDRLTAATLKTFLYNLGYTPESGAGAGPPYTITGTVSGAPWPILVTLSPGDEEIILFTQLPAVGDASRIPASVSVGILAENDNGPSHFSYDPEGKRFVLSVVFTNGGVTPAYFRARLEYFLDILSRTAPLWDPSKWVTSPPAGTQTTEKPAEPGEKVTAETGGSPDHAAEGAVAIRPSQAAEVQKLLDAGTDPNKRGPSETTFLMGAAFRADVATIKVLLAKGADPNSQNAGGNTALMYSIVAGAYEVIEDLVRAGADVDLLDRKGHSAISYVRMTDARRIEILNLLVNAPIRNPLPVAALAQRTLADIGEFKKAVTNTMLMRLPPTARPMAGNEPTKEDLERLQREIERDTKERDLINYESPVWDEVMKAETVASQFASNPLPERVAAVRAALERLLSRCTTLTSSKEWKELVEVQLGHPVFVGDAQLRRDLRHLGQAPR